MDFDPLKPDTLLQHYGEEEKLHGAVIPPIFQNSLFVFPTYDEFLEAYHKTPQGPPYHYSRLGNPTLDLVERKLAKLEGAEAAKVFGGGMGAIFVAIMSCVESGAHVVAADTCYSPVRVLLAEYLARFGVRATFVDGRCHEDVLDAVTPETKLIYLESPSSFVFRLQDLETIARGAREKGVPTVVDNTWATPLFQNPLALGIDLVVHSGTKYLSGHSDVTAGVVCGSQERIDRMVRNEINYCGNLLSPFGAWLLLRGLRTLKVRLKAHEAAANELAGWLEDRPEVERVFHLGLPTHPQRGLFRKQMRGSSGLFSFQPKDQSPEKIKRFVDSLELFGIGVSWGGFESLVMPMEVKPMDWPEARYLVRFHVGLEDVDDLKVDVERAFAKSGL
ncbi:MAG TPA: PLP-dependent aspartate aminotransferase family protein [Fimbriimonadaceae bacterium]|nr:PLP-dependent aspartate aminotransferase family protein [Fimbriimonadaceae bacterium]